MSDTPTQNAPLPHGWEQAHMELGARVALAMFGWPWYNVCACGAHKDEHHAPSIVTSGCIVSPIVGHSCPCLSFKGVRRV